MNFDEFLNQGWVRHAENATAVAERLPQGLALIEKAEQIPALANFATHVFGEHLGLLARRN